jgi:hypothetical protein
MTFDRSRSVLTAPKTEQADFHDRLAGVNTTFGKPMDYR